MTTRPFGERWLPCTLVAAATLLLPCSAAASMHPVTRPAHGGASHATSRPVAGQRGTGSRHTAAAQQSHGRASSASVARSDRHRAPERAVAATSHRHGQREEKVVERTGHHHPLEQHAAEVQTTRGRRRNGGNEVAAAPHIMSARALARLSPRARARELASEHAAARESAQQAARDRISERLDSRHAARVAEVQNRTRETALADPAPAPAPPANFAEPLPRGGHNRSIHHEPAATADPAGQASSRLSTQDFLRAARGTSLPLTAAGATGRSQVSTAAVARALPEMPAQARRSAVSGESSLPDATLVARSGARSRVVPSAAAARTLMPVDRNEEAGIVAAAVEPALLPRLITEGGRLVVPPPMRGSHDILVHQNQMATQEGLERIQDDEQLDRMRASRQLVVLNSSAALDVNEDLPLNRRYARPWTVEFVEDTAHAFYNRFGVPLRLNSAVRTVSYQLRLQRVNGNAAAIDGDGASPHLTGQAIDFGKRGMSSQQIAWMRQYLTPLMASGKLDVEEEFQQACFHISVYRAYAASRRTAGINVAAAVRTRDSGAATSTPLAASAPLAAAAALAEQDR